MKTACTHCGGINETASESIGKECRCTTCGEMFAVQNPNLTPCPDCFAPISKRASTCPHCGAPFGEINAPLNAQTNRNTCNIAEEKEIMTCQPSGKNYLIAIIIGIITLPLLFGAVVLLCVWVDIYYTRYRITNLRVIVTRGFFEKQQTEIWIKDMRGANLSQNLWQRLIGVGNIAIGTAASAGTEISIVGIANPQTVVDQINALRR